MKFLIDVCIGRRFAKWLKELGYDVCEVRERSAKMEDSDILLWARFENRIVITADKDFGTLAVALGQPHAGIVRFPDVSLAERQSLMEELLKRHKEDLQKGLMITVSRNNIRVRRI